VILVIIFAFSNAKAAEPDQACEKVAQFAKAMAMIRESGVAESEFEDYISTPKAQAYPITLIRKQIYAQSLNHDQAYVVYRDKCLAMGFTQLLSFMNDEDELERSRSIIEQQKTRIEQLQFYNQRINQLLDAANRKTTVENKPVPTYGEPIEGRIVTH
jgi:hypothetical protein